MHTGDLLIHLTLGVTVAAIAAYILAALGSKVFMRCARVAYLASAVFIAAISAYFLTLILNNRFEIDYIARNSSTDLALAYKISVFWAGQQGSFLFWALSGAVIGLVVMRKAREFEPWAMAFWSVVQGFFLYLLVVDSPFKLAPEVLSDGMGLRELLQNSWMVVHPPVTFVGYAAICVPAAFAFAALIKGDFKGWSRVTLPWAIFGWVSLGAGIILGSYWAYEVLGWGGYWGWDPVENSSLVPWIIGTALVHTMIAERYRGSFRRVNVVLALITFAFVFYASFLTRSDAIKDSVHTFGKTETAVPLVYFILEFLVLAAALVVWRWRKMTGKPSYSQIASKDFLFFLAAIFIVISGFLVILGTSAPMIGKLFLMDISLKADFYNRTISPVAVAVLALMALAPIIPWRRESESGSRDNILLIAGAVVIGVVILITAIGYKHSMHYLTYMAIGMFMMAAAGLLTNVYALIKAGKFGIRAIGGFAAHAGVAIMFLGIVLSANEDKPRTFLLNRDNTHTIRLTETRLPLSTGQYRFTYLGSENNDGKMGMKLRVESGGKSSDVTVKMQSTRMNEVLSSPAVISSFVRDIYIAPQAGPDLRDGIVRRGETVDLRNFSLTFVGFNLQPVKDNEQRIEAKLKIEADGKTETITPWVIKRRPEPSSAATDIPGMNASISITGISVEDRAVNAVFTPKSGRSEPIVLVKGEKEAIGGYELLFKEWFFPSGNMGGMQVGARIDVTSGGKTVNVEPVYNAGLDRAPKMVSEPVVIRSTGDIIELRDVDVDKGLVDIAVLIDSIVINVSIKPFMSLFWAGSIIALLGGTIALWRRSKEKG